MLMATQSPTTVLVVTAVMLALDIVAVALRIAARRQRRQPLLADDWFCFLALVCCNIHIASNVVKHSLIDA
jgi:hypothetical protein